MEAQGKKVAILAEDLYEDPELWYPYYRMREAGAEVVVVGPQAGATYQSKHGYPVQSDVAAADVRGTDFDAVIVPGGFSPDRMRRSPDMVRLVREAYEAGKIVAAICHGPWMLISAGAVRGRRATCFFAIKDDLVNGGATYVDQEVVRDGNVITSRTPADLPAFCRTILAALGEG
ncbi:MAG: type 1 glutamine amidotransferase [Anaerolineae bacterium]|nr:type 1 glutamine amidotransferase [Anaerolineae bacterium]